MGARYLTEAAGSPGPHKTAPGQVDIRQPRLYLYHALLFQISFLLGSSTVGEKQQIGRKFEIFGANIPIPHLSAGSLACESELMLAN